MQVARMSKEIKHPHQWVDLLHAVDHRPGDRELAAAIELVIARAELRNAYEKVQQFAGRPELASLRPDLPEALQRAYWATRLMHRDLDPEAPPRGLRERLALVPSLLRLVRTR
jgi:hypothetical protein